MSVVQSATTSSSPRSLKSSEFLHKAHQLLAAAITYRGERRHDLALEYAYQAGLRTAAARIAASPVAHRVRKPTNAWDQLRLVDAEAAQWADAIGQYSRLRSRVNSGIEAMVSEETIDTVIELVGKFLNSVEFDNDDTPAAA